MTFAEMIKKIEIDMMNIIYRKEMEK